MVKKEDGRSPMGSAMISERVGQQAEKASGLFRPQGLPAGWGLGWKPPSSFELQVGALSRELMGRGGWGDDRVGGEPTERMEDACCFLPRLLCRAGAWALSSRSTACTLRWRSSSTSGVGGGGDRGREAFRLGALRLSCPSLTLPSPPPLSLRMSLASSSSLKRSPKAINLELAACILARAGKQPFDWHVCVLCTTRVSQGEVYLLPEICGTIPFVSFWLHHEACGILVPLLRIKSMSPAVEV